MLVAVFAVVLCSCGGNISKVSRVTVQSEKYSQEDIDSAIDAALDYFKEHFNGCTMKKIGYAGDDRLDEWQSYVESFKYDEAIVLTSEYETGSSVDGGFEPNRIYKDYGWVLFRNKGEKWEHWTHGYG